MSIVSPFHDACVAGCVANASLHPSAKREAPTHREAASFTPAPMRAEASAPQAAPCRARWRRIARRGDIAALRGLWRQARTRGDPHAITLRTWVAAQRRGGRAPSGAKLDRSIDPMIERMLEREQRRLYAPPRKP